MTTEGLPLPTMQAAQSEFLLEGSALAAPFRYARRHAGVVAAARFAGREDGERETAIEHW